MVYLLYGNNNYLIDRYIKTLTKAIDKMNITIYDLDKDPVSLIIEDCETFSMFQEKKVVIADNATMFTGASNKDSDIIQKYLININPSTILIFTVHSEKIDGRKKITNLIKTKGEIKEFNDNINIESYVKDLLKNYNISYSDTKYLIERVGDNPLTLKNEIDKIILYKQEDHNITTSDIKEITIRNLNSNIFKFIDNIVCKRKEEAICNYHDMLLMGQEPIMIIIMLADQFRIMYQAKKLMMKGYNEKNIAEVIKIHPYRVKKAIENGRKYSSSILLKNLNDLAELDIGIKSGNLNKNLAFELFILNM